MTSGGFKEMSSPSAFKYHPLIARIVFVLLAIVLAAVLGGCGQISYTVEEHLNRGIEFEQQDDLAAASIEYRNAVQQDPASSEARYRLGILMLKVGDAAGAEEELNRARERGWDPDDLRLPLLRAALMQNRYGRVMDETRLMDSFPEGQVASALALRGWALLATGNPREAETALGQALEFDPDLLDAQVGMAQLALVSGGDRAQAQAWLERAVKAHPRAYQAWELLGDLELAAGRLDQAEEAFGQAVKHAYGRISPRAKRAYVRAVLHDYPSAEQDLQVLQRTTRGHPVVSFVQGLVAFNQQRFPEAQVSFEAALAGGADYQPAIFYLGATHVALRNRQQAEYHLSRFLNANPNSNRAAHMLAMIRLDDGDLDRAERLLKPLLDRSPDDTIALSLMGNVHLARGQRQEGLAQLQRVAVLRPDDASARANLGVELLRAGEMEEGLRQLESALELAPGAEGLEATLIFNLIRAGEFDAASESIDRFEERAPDNPVPHKLRGVALLAQDDAQAATDSFEKALSLSPGDPSATLILGRMALGRGALDEARGLFEESLRHHPDNVDVVMQLARLKMQSGQLDETLNLVRRMQQVAPDEPFGHIVEGQLHRARADYEAAVEAYRRGYKLAPTADLAIALGIAYQGAGRPQEAVTLLSEHRDSHGATQSLLGALGEAQINAQLYDEAVATLEHLARVAPELPDAQLTLARAYAGQGRADKVRAALERTLSLQPNHLQAGLARVRLDLQEGLFDQANRHYEILREAHPDQPGVFAVGGELALAAGRHVDAVTNFRRALDRTPSQRLVIQLARAQALAGEAAAGVETLENWLEQHPGDVMVRHLLGDGYIAMGRTDDAIRVLSKAVEQQPNNIVALNNLAWLLRESDPDEALRHAERAYAQAPDSPAVRDTLGMVLLEHSGEHERAVRLLREASEAVPDNLTTRYHLAVGLARVGDEAEAKAVLIAILGEEREFPERGKARSLLDSLGR
jgi:tetratricopeptide (TPR) repeat protein